MVRWLNMNQIEIEIKRLNLHNNLEIRKLTEPKLCRGKKQLERDIDFKNLILERNIKYHLMEKLLVTYPQVWLVDYTALSVVPLKEKKARYLLNKNGNYYIKGFVVAYNPALNQKIVIETTRTQLATIDIKRLKQHLPKDAIIISDKQHYKLNIYSVSKKITQQIEILFSPLKREVYRKIKRFQTWLGNYLVTNISLGQLENIYYEFMANQGFEIMAKCKPKLEHKKLP